MAEQDTQVTQQTNPQQEQTAPAVPPVDPSKLIATRTQEHKAEPTVDTKPTNTGDFTQYATGNEILDSTAKSVCTMLGCSYDDMAKALGKAVQYGDVELIDATVLEKNAKLTEEQKNTLKSLASAYIAHTAQSQSKVTEIAYGVAGGKQAWDRAVQVFKSTAPAYLIETVKTMIDSGRVKEGAEMLMQSVAQTGYSNQPDLLGGGGFGGGNGLSYLEFKQELRKLEQEAGNRSFEGSGEYAQRYRDLLARRSAGRRAGL